MNTASQASGDVPKITFGMIVLNGNPFIRYSLRALYPNAHQIVVVEGACPAAANVATDEGHSIDGTLETLRAFKRLEDPLGKLTVVTAEDEGRANGFWEEKSDMSQAYAKRATGNYLWQVDSDEFYTPDGLQTVIDFLSRNPDVTEVSLRTINFWGGLRYKVDGLILKLGDRDFHRIFAWGPGSAYVTHRPPTVINSLGQNVAEVRPVSAAHMAKLGVFLHHYEYLFPHQVRHKAAYYAQAEHCHGLRGKATWADECYMSLSNPYRVHNIVRWPSWLEKYDGPHPPQILQMMRDVASDGTWSIRRTDDVEELINNRRYRLGVIGLKVASPFVNMYMSAKLGLRRLLISLGLWQHVQFLRIRRSRAP